MALEKKDLEELPKQAKATALKSLELVEARTVVKSLKSGKSKALLRLAELGRRKKDLDVTSEGAISELTEIEAETSAARTVLKTIQEKLDDAEEKLDGQEEMLRQVD